MAISGSLETMPVSELFQWAGQNTKTGVLRVAEGKNTIKFAFENGRVTGCSSNDPPSMLGQFLLSRGKLEERDLQQALSEQERTGENLGQILVERGCTTNEELARYILAKAEDTIYRLFEWTDARFKFEPSLSADPNMMAVDFSVDDILLRGARRRDELDHMRSIFDHPGIVLCHTDHTLNPETASTPMARRLYELVDGKRTFREVVLLSRASEFLAIKFLYQLYRRGIICIRDVHEVAPDPGTPESACELAMGLVARGELEAALETLQTSQVNHPASDLVQRTLIKVEATYLDRAYEKDVPSNKVPVKIRDREAGEQPTLSSNELFVIGLIEGGNWDVKSLVQIAPLHEIDVIRAVKGLLTKGLIDLRGDSKPDPIDLPEIPAGEAEPKTDGFAAEIEDSLEGILRTVRDRDRRTG